ncbi:MAG: alpha-ribazole phosphatase [Thermoanaerobaculia bacterium]
MIEQLILVRHGETLHNVAGIAQGWGDSELSERGQSQVARVAERLKRSNVDAIFSSPLQRALSTAAKIGEATALPVRIVDALREMNYGEWEGQSFLDIRKRDEPSYRRWIAEEEFPCPGGESHSEVLARIQQALNALSGVRRPVLVSHGTAIRVAATALLGLPLSSARNFAQDNTAVNVFVRRGEHWVLKLWNDTTHCEQG